MKAVNTISHDQDPNSRIAPWYNLYSLEQQRAMKTQNLQEHLEKLNLTHTYQDLLHVPPYTAYRNNNKFTFGYAAEALDLANDDPTLLEHVRLGFIAGGYPTSYIIPCDKAVTINDAFKELCHIVEKIVQKSGIKPFLMPPRSKRKRRKKDPSTPYVPYQGVWRYLKIRYSLEQDQYMVFMVNFSRYLEGEAREAYETVLERIRKALDTHEKVAVFSVQEYHLTLEPQPYDPIRILLDKSKEQEGTLCEKLMGCQFLVSPTSFFQVNTAAAEKLYAQIYALFEEKVGRYINNNRNILLDMYCGTGSIGITLNPLFDGIIGIDEIEASIQNAEKNKSMNQVRNARYIVGRCEDTIPLLEKMLGGIGYNLYILVNPAREGLHRKVRKFIKKTPHEALVYSSCDVNTWARDVADLTSPSTKKDNLQPLKMEKSYIVDLFPHTKHYEVVSRFTSDYELR